jgi:MoaA/NifB/PqqE/SkfB family radical SAM enzyme
MSIPRLVLRGSMQDPLSVCSAEEKRLVYLMVNLPYQCNYRCLKCCNHLATSDPSPGENLDSRLVTESIHSVSNIAARVVVFAGEGEPLLHPEFLSLVKEVHATGLLPYVFTNGSLLTKENVDFLAANGATLIISMDSIDPETYRRLTGERGSLQVILANIRYCREVYRDLIEEKDGLRLTSLAVNMVVNQLNVAEAESIREFCGEDIAFVCNRPTRIGLAEHNWEVIYGQEASNSSVDSVIDNLSKDHPPLGTTPDGRWCAYMRNGISISPQGEILTCAYAIGTAGCYGKLNSADLASANRRVMESVDEFYRLHGHSRCILRHAKYKEFIAVLRQNIVAGNTVAK